MGFWSRIRQEFIEIIEWVDEGRDTVVYRFPIHKEIKNNAKLTVREGQQAVFLYKGQVADVYKPGMYSLTTDNMPVLSTLLGWKYGFESPFKADIYFVTTRRFSDMKWGTPQPVEIYDQRFGPVRVRANGIYDFQVVDAPQLIRSLAGTDPNFDTEEISRTLREHVVSNFTEVLVQGGWGVFEMKAKMTEISDKVMEACKQAFKEFGIKTRALKIRSMTVPPAVQEAMDRSASMGMIGNMGRYQAYQLGNAMGEMGSNPGSAMGNAMGAGAGIGMGFGMMNTMGGMPGMAPMGGYQQRYPYPPQGGYPPQPPQGSGGYPPQPPQGPGGYPPQPPQGPGGPGNYPPQAMPPYGYPPQQMPPNYGGQPGQYPAGYPQGGPGAPGAQGPMGQPGNASFPAGAPGTPPSPENPLPQPVQQPQTPDQARPVPRNPNIMRPTDLAAHEQVQAMLAAGEITPEKAKEMLDALNNRNAAPPQA